MVAPVLVLMLLLIGVLGPFLLALGLLTITDRCERWLDGTATARPEPATPALSIRLEPDAEITALAAGPEGPGQLAAAS